MAIIKLVCQGCGARLDVDDGAQIVTCEYCGTQNQIKQTRVPQPPPPQQVDHAHHHYHHHPAQPTAAPRRLMVLGLLPLLIGLGVTGFVLSKTTDVAERISARVGGGGGEAELKVFWNSGRPLVADLNGDGSDDMLAMGSISGETKVQLFALSGTDDQPLWRVELGTHASMPGTPRVLYAAESNLALFALGAALHAYDGKTGDSRWLASMPDVVEHVAMGEGVLWVAATDGSFHHVTLADGSVKGVDAWPEQGLTLLPEDKRFELIPSTWEPGLASDAFDDLRVVQAFCPRDRRIMAMDDGRMAAPRCPEAPGLAFATRRKGSSVPFLVGYDPQTKAERWRQQMTTPGSIEGVKGGFGQPRAVFVGDGEAIVSFARASDDGVSRLRRLQLSDGEVVWEQTVKTHLGQVDGLRVGSDRLYLVSAGAVHRFDLATGEFRGRLGR